MKISAHQALINELRANNTVSRERLAALENDPIALCDLLAQSDDFIRKYHNTTDIVYKENDNALVSAEPERHLVDVEEVGEAVYELRKEFKTGDEILTQRIKDLEKQVSELKEQLQIFNRVSDIALKIGLQWINKQSSK